MNRDSVLSRAYVNLGRAWFALVGLSALGVLLGTIFHDAGWLPVAVALVIWLKGTTVARVFLEERHSHPFIRWVLRVFVAFVPFALLVIAVLGQRGA